MSKDSPTIDELVEIIAADMKNSAATGQPLKYPAIDQIRATSDEWASMHDMPTAFGKSHGECTLGEGKMLNEAYRKIRLQNIDWVDPDGDAMKAFRNTNPHWN